MSNMESMGPVGIATLIRGAMIHAARLPGDDAHLAWRALDVALALIERTPDPEMFIPADAAGDPERLSYTGGADIDAIEAGMDPCGSSAGMGGWSMDDDEEYPESAGDAGGAYGDLR